MTATAAIHAPALDDLLGLTGQVATAVVVAPNASEHARDQLEIRTRDVASHLTEAGAPDALVDAITAALWEDLDGAPSGKWIGVVADAERARVVPLVDAGHEVVACGTLPRFVPFVRDRFEYRPHVVVRCDRVGADVTRVLRDHRSDQSVHGAELHVQKVHSGGFSQARMQRHSEHTWDQNAQKIVDAVIADVAAVDAALIVVTGDERAVQLVRDHLPEAWQDRLLVDDVQPSDEVDEELVFAHAVTLVRDRAATELVDLLQRFAEARGRQEAAADGVEEVLAALRRGAVDTLLVAEDADDEVYVAIEDPRQVARDRQQLADAGSEHAVPARLADAAIAAAAAGGSAVVVTPEHGPDTPNGPLGALLRY